jgi:hypothetical protein
LSFYYATVRVYAYRSLLTVKGKTEARASRIPGLPLWARGRAGRLDVLAGERDEVAAVADAHRVVAQDLEQLAARSGRET